MKRYVLIAGVNGAGKSTLYQVLDSSIKEMPRVNVDEIVRSFGDWRNFADVFKAGKIAVKQIETYLKNEQSFNQETTLCGTSIIRNIEKAKVLGYKVELYYVGIDSVEIAKSRIAYRVSKGGHGIPDKDVERRYFESFQKLIEVIPLCDRVILHDNTIVFNRFAVYEKGKLIKLSETIPEWYTHWIITPI